MIVITIIITIIIIITAIVIIDPLGQMGFKQVLSKYEKSRSWL